MSTEQQHSQEHTQESETLESSGGASMSPPAFNLSAQPVQRQEDPAAEAQQPEQTPDPFADLDEDHRDPLLNSNTVYQNLQLLIQEWQASDGTNDDRKLSHILATAMLESGRTFQSVNENLDTNYFPGHYAPTGYWGRGFVQLTWEDNYESTGDEIGLDLEDHRQAAVLPTISAYTTANGMIDGDFTTRSLNDYLPVTENADGTQTEGQADWFNARRVVNGIDDDPNHWSHEAAVEISNEAQSIHGDILVYRAGIADGSIQASVTLAEYLYSQTNHFDNFADTDALRIVEALGHMDFQTPNMSGGTDMQQQYGDEVSEVGHAGSMSRINNQTERNAIRAFQADFNANHNLETPLPETGTLDDRTLEMMLLGGNRIASGENMIEGAFEGQVESRDLYAEALAAFQASEISMNDLATRLHSYMPAQTVTDVTGIFDALEGQAASLAFQLARVADSHDKIAVMNTEVLVRMHALLGASADATYQAQAERVNAVMTYTPPEPEYTTHVVQSGETLSVIARQYGMTYQELGDLNNIPPPYSAIRVGQELRIPNPNANNGGGGGGGGANNVR